MALSAIFEPTIASAAIYVEAIAVPCHVPVPIVPVVTMLDDPATGDIPASASV